MKQQTENILYSHRKSMSYAVYTSLAGDIDSELDTLESQVELLRRAITPVLRPVSDSPNEREDILVLFKDGSEYRIECGWFYEDGTFVGHQAVYQQKFNEALGWLPLKEDY